MIISWETYARKSTARTLQQIRQQYPSLFRDSTLHKLTFLLPLLTLQRHL
jgi:hypothetical protein